MDRMTYLYREARGVETGLRNAKKALAEAEKRNPRSMVVVAYLIHVGKLNSKRDRIFRLIGRLHYRNQ